MPKTQQIRQERRARAEEVAVETGYSKLSNQQKLERVLTFIAIPGNGEAKKQRARLEALLRKENEPAPAPVASDENGNVEKPYKKGKKYRK